MKKTVSLLLAVLFTLSVLCLVSCGKINDSNVAVLWSGDGVATDPNSLINSMDRAMYIEKIAYEHYGAKGDAAQQVQQAKAAVDAGCAALVVELITPLTAQEIVDYAKAKSIPVVLISSVDLIPDSVTASYDKCFVISSDITTVAEVQGEMIADYVKANYKNLDKDEDGKITYFAYDLGVISEPAVKKANELLATEDYMVKGADKQQISVSVVAADVDFKDLLDIPVETYEMILTADDKTAFEVLLKLQGKDYNTDKLTTHFVPVFTVGAGVDYKAYVVEQGKDKYENNKYLVDLTTVSEEDLAEMIYTTRNVIDSGRLAGTVIEDNDAIAISAAKIISNLLKQKDATAGVASEPKKDEAASVVVNGSDIKVRYIVYTK